MEKAFGGTKRYTLFAKMKQERWYPGKFLERTKSFNKQVDPVVQYVDETLPHMAIKDTKNILSCMQDKLPHYELAKLFVTTYRHALENIKEALSSDVKEMAEIERDYIRDNVHEMQFNVFSVKSTMTVPNPASLSRSEKDELHVFYMRLLEISETPFPSVFASESEIFSKLKTLEKDIADAEKRIFTNCMKTSVRLLK